MSTPLINLIKQNTNSNIDISSRVRRVLESGQVNVNERDPQGNTPLHLLAKRKFSNDIMKMLIDHGADINSENAMNITPLSIAVVWDIFTSVQFLIENGANVHNINNQGENLLFSASNNNILQLLIEKGLDINSRDSRGRTPLHSSIEDVPNFRKFKFLIENGADPNVRDSSDKTPLNYAEENVIVLNSTLSENLSEDDITEFEEQLENNRRIITILITKMNKNNNPESRFWTGYSYHNDECSICYQELSDGRQICVNKKCEHGFHCECINKWLNTIDNYNGLPKTTCPLCRKPLEIVALDELQQRAIQNSFGKKRKVGILGIRQLNSFKKYLDSL